MPDNNCPPVSFIINQETPQNRDADDIVKSQSAGRGGGGVRKFFCGKFRDMTRYGGGGGLFFPKFVYYGIGHAGVSAGDGQKMNSTVDFFSEWRRRAAVFPAPAALARNLL